MRELSLNEIGMVSGGKHDHLRGGGSDGLALPIKVGAVSGATTYVGNVISGSTEFNLGHMCIATAASAAGGAAGVPFSGSHGVLIGVGVGGLTSGFITEIGKMAQSNGKVGSTSTNNASNDPNKTGDNYNIGHK